MTQYVWHPSTFSVFWQFIGQRIVESEGHWLWKGSIDENGYGIARLDRKNVRAHRLVMSLAIGRQLERSEHIHHWCEHRNCVNPDHLRITGQDWHTSFHNYLRPLRDECKNGHEFTPENTYRGPDGKRRCRECQRVRNERRRKTPQLRDHDRARRRRYYVEHGA